MIDALTALDGRYAKLTKELSDVFSEYGLIKERVFVEIEWLKFILFDLKLAQTNNIETQKLDAIKENFCLKDAEKIKKIEKKTNHDVKAVEYFIKEELELAGLSDIKEWVHFACTSDDINNTSYALMLDKGKKITTALLRQLI